MNDLTQYFDTGHLSLILLIAGLFLPRLSLLVAWLMPGNYPPNNLSDLVNFLGWLFLPRFLMAYYIYNDIGYMNFWFWAYLIVGLFALFGEGHVVHRRVIRRTTVYGDGRRVTTVEEEV